MSQRACPDCCAAGPALLFHEAVGDTLRCSGRGAVCTSDDSASIDFDALDGEADCTGGSDAAFADEVGQESARSGRARRELLLLRTLPPRIARSGRLLAVGGAAGGFLALTLAE